MNNKETLQANNERIETNNVSLESILETINNLPEVGSNDNGDDTNNTIVPNGTNELGEVLSQIVSEWCAKRDNLPNTYPAYYNEPVTLYSPADGYNYYLIRKRGTNNYGIAWFNQNVMPTRNNNNEYYFRRFIISLSGSSLLPGNTPNIAIDGTFNSVIGYTSPSYTTIEECLSAIQSPNTVYTASASSYTWGAQLEGEYSSPFSNMTLQDYGVFALSQRVSKDETIVVIPTE